MTTTTDFRNKASRLARWITPATAPLTEEYIRKAGLSGRITTRRGDVLHDPLGENYDLIFASQGTHVFSPEENRHLFHRAYQALAPRGRMVVQDFILDATKTSPLGAALFSLNMLAGSRAGSSYSEPEYVSWFQDAGFTDVCRLHCCVKRFTSRVFD